jgi:hypothetical protein
VHQVGTATGFFTVSSKVDLLFCVSCVSGFTEFSNLFLLPDFKGVDGLY